MPEKFFSGGTEKEPAVCGHNLAWQRSADPRIGRTDENNKFGFSSRTGERHGSSSGESKADHRRAASRLDEAEVTPSASFQEDLGADSLDVVELVMQFEEAFDLEIPDEDAEKIKTVKDATDYIEKNAKGGK